MGIFSRKPTQAEHLEQLVDQLVSRQELNPDLMLSYKTTYDELVELLDPTICNFKFRNNDVPSELRLRAEEQQQRLASFLADQQTDLAPEERSHWPEISSRLSQCSCGCSSYTLFGGRWGPDQIDLIMAICKGCGRVEQWAEKKANVEGSMIGEEINVHV